MKKILFSFILLPLFTLAQKGINFEHANSWKQVVEKAKAENKYIFMDAFTTWCGPCRYMSNNVFTKPEVGDVFNKNFINVKVQLDTTAKDNEDVKQWYADAHMIMNEFKVNVFPTFLFFDPTGKLVHRMIGSSEAPEFTANATLALNPENQYYVMLEKYQAGKKDPAFLRKLALASASAYDLDKVRSFSKEYLATQTDFMSADNLDFIQKFTQSSMDPGFDILVKNEDRINKVKNDDIATNTIVNIVSREMVLSKSNRGAKPDWDAITTAVKAKYPKHAAEVLSGSKVAYYQRTGDWANFQAEVQQYMKNYGKKATTDQLNSFAWAVFENCKDMTCVKEALTWSKRSFEKKDDPTFIDTYANILYKLGKKEEAIKWEEKALALAGETEKADYQSTLDKMKKGEKTWKD